MCNENLRIFASFSPPIRHLRSRHYDGVVRSLTPSVGIDRESSRRHLKERSESGLPFDIVVIGGGITGAGVALDASLRGFDVLLVERGDFASGTSSKSSKLVHGGLRYLQQGDVALVREALRERSILQRTAPGRVEVLPFLLPIFTRDGLFPRRIARALGSALWAYDTAGGWRIGRLHRRLRKSGVAKMAPLLNSERIAGGYIYYDARADDARLTLDVVTTAAHAGAVAVNYCAVEQISVTDGHVSGVTLNVDGEHISVLAKSVVNAAGVWAERVDDLVNTQLNEPIPALTVRPARGVHVTIPWELVQTRVAMVLPVPGDKRSVFLVPDMARPDGSFEVAYIGTTDTDHDGSLDAPECSSEDVEYLLRAVNAAMETTVTREHVIGVWSGLRPLVTSDDAPEGRTADVSRRHRVDMSPSGYVRVVGGKLTTYRAMAEDTVDHVEQVMGTRKPCSTRKTALLDRNERVLKAIADAGCSQSELLPGSQLSETDVVYAVRHEAAVHLIDVMTRRSRLHLLHRSLAERCAEPVSQIMQRELGWSDTQRDEEIKNYADVCRSEIDAMSEGMT